MDSRSAEVDDEVIYDLVLNAYNKLPLKGKPKANEEWTHLAAVVIEIVNAGGLVERREVVSMGTGTRCIGRSKLVDNGTLVRDSHAEVIARRCFMVYLYDCLLAFHGKMPKCSINDIFEAITVDGKCRIKPNIRFDFFLTHPPCGDAAIFDKPTDFPEAKREEGSEEEVEEEDIGIGVSNVAKNEEDEEPPSKSRRISNDVEGDICRTGAKVVPASSIQDPLLPRCRYHVLGVLRSKPGRGDPTLSMSCSDKMLKWLVLGYQGALLSHFIDEPIRFCRLIFAKCLMDPAALTRALSLSRLSASVSGIEQPPLPKVVILKRQFNFSRDSVTNSIQSNAKPSRPVATSICCYRSTYGGPTINVLVDGFKQGSTKKHVGTPKSASFISSYELFRKFISLVDSLPVNVKSQLCLPESTPQLMTYAAAKQSSSRYTEFRNRCVSSIFKGWLLKPAKLSEFTLPKNTNQKDSETNK